VGQIGPREARFDVKAAPEVAVVLGVLCPRTRGDTDKLKQVRQTRHSVSGNDYRKLTVDITVSLSKSSFVAGGNPSVPVRHIIRSLARLLFPFRTARYPQLPNQINRLASRWRLDTGLIELT
jgi:hypothetical protein